MLDEGVADIQNGRAVPRLSYDHATECLRLASATLCAAGPTFDPWIKLSLASVGELFTLAIQKAYNRNDNKCPNGWSGLIDRDFWSKVMLSSGWCPSQLNSVLDDAASLQARHLFAYLGRPESSKAHQRCNEQQCLSLQNDIYTYQTQHTTIDCECEEFSAETTELSKILESGCLPLLRIRKAHNLKKVSVDLVSSQLHTEYVALSHVWADGLGNPRENALPRCQLDFLSRLIDGINRNSCLQKAQENLLWCDTLCCPVRPTAAKNLALTQMRRTYAQAAKVLVLDASLRNFKSELLGPEEACVRVLTSGWTRRLWTLQEGVLGAENGRLWFQFKDKAVKIHDLLAATLSLYKASLGKEGLASYLAYKIRTFAEFSHSSPTLQPDLGSVEASVRHRSVSVSSDEPLLIGNLLELDPTVILDGPPFSRMQRMWSLMPKMKRVIPKNILFRVGPRIDEVGFRWAPATLLYREPANSWLYVPKDTNEHGTPTEHGLLVTLAGYSLEMPHRPVGLESNHWIVFQMEHENDFYARGFGGTWYLIYRRLPKERDHFLTNRSLLSMMHEESLLWIIHADPLDPTARTEGIQQAVVGLVVRMTRQDGGVNYGNSKLHICIGVVRRSTNILLEAAHQLAQQVPQTPPAQKLAKNYVKRTNEDSKAFKEVLRALEDEMLCIAQSADEGVLAVAREVSTNPVALLREMIAKSFAGSYGSLGRKMPDSQRWCVD